MTKPVTSHIARADSIKLSVYAKKKYGCNLHQHVYRDANLGKPNTYLKTWTTLLSAKSTKPGR
jgi:hypothetical protein